MNRTQALQMDKAGEFYADYDDETESWCVFGTESGFCYASYYEERQAQKEAEKMTKKYGAKMSASTATALADNAVKEIQSASMSTKQAEEMGKAAFERGLKAGPTLDKDFMKKLEQLPVGKMGYLIPYLEAWSRGWHKANLDAPT